MSRHSYHSNRRGSFTKKDTPSTTSAQQLFLKTSLTDTHSCASDSTAGAAVVLFNNPLPNSEKMAEKNDSDGAKEFTELDWIALKNDLGTAQMQSVETSASKFSRKFYENPFVPIGCGLTTLALCYGLYSFSTGKRGTSQNMMRLRVVAQGFTVAALMLGIAKTSMQ